MGVVWRVLPPGIADTLPLTLWPEAAQEHGAPEAWLTAASIWELGPYLRAIGAVYDAPAPVMPSPKRRFPELSQSAMQALWEGSVPAGVSPQRAREFYDAEIAVARTRPSGPGVPAFKLFENGPPWHVTAKRVRRSRAHRRRATGGRARSRSRAQGMDAVAGAGRAVLRGAPRPTA